MSVESVTVYPFHRPVPGLPDLFHVSCAEHPEFGFCGTREQAYWARLDHLADTHGSHAAAFWRDAPTPQRRAMTPLTAALLLLALTGLIAAVAVALGWWAVIGLAAVEIAACAWLDHHDRQEARP